MSPRHSANVLPTVPKCKETMLCLVEKIYVLDRLSSSMSDSLLAVSSVLVSDTH